MAKIRQIWSHWMRPKQTFPQCQKHTLSEPIHPPTHCFRQSCVTRHNIFRKLFICICFGGLLLMYLSLYFFIYFPLSFFLSFFLSLSFFISFFLFLSLSLFISFSLSLSCTILNRNILFLNLTLNIFVRRQSFNLPKLSDMTPRSRRHSPCFPFSVTILPNEIRLNLHHFNCLAK